MERFQNGLNLSSVVQKHHHEQQGLLPTKIPTPAPMLHPAAFLFTWALLFSSQCLQIELIRCKISLLTSPPFSFSSFFFYPGSIPWSDSSHGPTSCWVSTTEVGMLYRDGRSGHQEEEYRWRKGQTWAWLLKLVLLLFALHLGNMVLAWVRTFKL